MGRSRIDGLIGGIELGGTKVLAGVATDPLAPLKRIRVPTGDPESTLESVTSFFCAAKDELGALASIGIGSFGPIDIRPDSAQWGHMGRTTKPGWEGADIVSALAERVDCPISLDTDVNAAALAETRWGAGRDVGTLVYLTVGTGIGGGVVIDGRTVRGAMHPEIGHVRIRQHPDDAYRSRCGFHDDCAEGLASGPAIVERFGRTLQELEPGHPFHAILADYLGQLCATLALVVSPQRIVIGGGVMAGAPLHDAVHVAMLRWLGGYLEMPSAAGSYIVPPGLGEEAGLAGAFALARDLVRSVR
jgi:fructokinase